MKLEVGMYVRTKVGNIGKIIDYHGDVTDYFWGCYETDLTESLSKNYITEVDILKASNNIIDLIEVGDYVNGCYVSNKRASVNEHLGGHPKGIGIIKCNAYFNQGNYNDCKFEWIEEKDIKSIITKEQFKSMEYRLRGD